MRKIFIILIVIVAVVVLAVLNKKEVQAPNYKDITYKIEGQDLMLGEQLQYFGNELWHDLDGDGDQDVTFLTTHQPGGSGAFYYAVAALATDEGFAGSDGYLLGDRIAPQAIELSPNPRHLNVIVVNYADRAEGESFTTPPSVAKSVYLKIDPEYMQWAIVEPDFEGEANI